jgi:hypothetical protein
LLGLPRHCHKPEIDSAEHGQEPDHIMLPGRVGNGGLHSISGISCGVPLVGFDRLAEEDAATKKSTAWRSID